MTKIPEDDSSKEKLQLLLFQLGEQLKEPPIMIDLYNWRDTVEIIMKDIQEVSPYVHDRLDALISEAMRLVHKHVMDLDRDISRKDSEQSAMDYFEQIAFVASEINAIKSL